MLCVILNTKFINNGEYISSSGPMIISPTDVIIIWAHKTVFALFSLFYKCSVQDAKELNVVLVH